MADSVDWYRPFPVISVTRKAVADVVGDEIASKLTDRDMKQLASHMRDAYWASDSFWDQIQIFVQYLVG